MRQLWKSVVKSESVDYKIIVSLMKKWIPPDFGILVDLT